VLSEPLAEDRWRRKAGPIEAKIAVGIAHVWQLVFNDPGTGDWNERWFVEGLKATVDYDEESLVFTSGPVPMEQASHAVLWTRRALWTAP